MRSNRGLVGMTAVAAHLLLAAADGTASEPSDVPQLTQQEEVAAALAAGPASIREDVGVFVLGTDGYRRVRESHNGFNCLVGRSASGSFEPMCFDAVGSASLLEQVLLRARLEAEGMSREAVADSVARAWSAGELRAPSRSGINYMLSTENRVPVGNGKVVPYRPHVMIYVPYLTNADLGGGADSPVFVINEGKPGAYLIIPVPDDR